MINSIKNIQQQKKNNEENLIILFDDLHNLIKDDDLYKALENFGLLYIILYFIFK